MPGNIKQCPFCGGAGMMHHEHSYYYFGNKLFVMCSRCKARGGFVVCKDDPNTENWQQCCADAVALWNSRPATDESEG